MLFILLLPLHRALVTVRQPQEFINQMKLTLTLELNTLSQGVKIIIYPVKDVARAKTLFGELLGIKPYVDSPVYVGFRVRDQEIGLDPNSHKAGMTPYYKVDNIKQSLKSLLDAGAQIQQEIKDVGGGRLTAIIRDIDGNLIGLVQSSW